MYSLEVDSFAPPSLSDCLVCRELTSVLFYRSTRLRGESLVFSGAQYELGSDCA